MKGNGWWASGQVGEWVSEWKDHHLSMETLGRWRMMMIMEGEKNTYIYMYKKDRLARDPSF